MQLFKTSADGKEVVIKLVRAGEIFGEVVLFEQDRFPVSACALTPVAGLPPAEEAVRLPAGGGGVPP